MFANDIWGSIAIPSAIGGLVMVAAFCVAVDAARLVTEKNTLQSIADAAVLAATNPDNISDKDRRNIAQATIDDYLAQTGEDLSIDMPIMKIDGRGEQVEVMLASTKDLIFGRIVGMSEYTVVASSTAVERMETMGVVNTTSVTFVMGFSNSMNERSGCLSRINMVKSAMTSVFGAQGEGTIETAFYPFNWGTVDKNVSTLQPGTEATLKAMRATVTSDGNVPSEAMEIAVKEQSDTNRPADQFIVFLTDGDVEDEKADNKGQFLPASSVEGATNTQACKDATEDVNLAKKHLENTNENAINNFGSICNDDDCDDGDDDETGELLPGLRHVDESEPVDTMVATAKNKLEVTGPRATQGSNHISRLAEDIEELQVFERNRTLACEPLQTMRVIDACGDAKDENISIIAIDLSGEEERAAEVLELCTGLIADSDELGDKTKRSEPNPNAEPEVKRTTLRNGGEMYVSEDGKTISVSLSDMNDLQEVLRKALPKNAQATTQRVVRLVR